MKAERPDVERELDGLMDFQRKTVDRVHERFWGPEDPTRRFLVADEVGLGKTLVARGVIANAIDHLWDDVDRIDVVYICSNGQIARQNLPKLRVGISEEDLSHTTLTASPCWRRSSVDLESGSSTSSPSLRARPSRSPRAGGTAGERVLLYWLLKRAWPQGPTRAVDPVLPWWRRV